MQTINFTIIANKEINNIDGVIINNTKKQCARIVFMSDNLNDKDIVDGIVENPYGFLYTHLTNQTNLFNHGYHSIKIDEELYTLEPKNTQKTENFFVSPRGIILNNEEVNTLIDTLGREVFNKVILETTVPKDFKYTKSEELNFVLRSNNVSLKNEKYTQNKKKIHDLITSYLNGKIDEKFIGIHLISKNSCKLITQKQKDNREIKNENLIFLLR